MKTEFFPVLVCIGKPTTRSVRQHLLLGVHFSLKSAPKQSANADDAISVASTKGGARPYFSRYSNNADASIAS